MHSRKAGIVVLSLVLATLPSACDPPRSRTVPAPAQSRAASIRGQTISDTVRRRGLSAGQQAASLDLLVPRWLEEHRVPSAAIAYIDEGVVQWTRVYGEQSRNVPATENTLYNVASLTKPVFAELMLRLVAAGKVSLDEPMATFWLDPDLAADERVRALTPRHALSHQTGFLGNWRSQSGGTLRFETRPGTRYGYSGEGYVYASRFLARKLGLSMDSLASEYVFAPFGMKSTSFTRRDWFEGRVATPRNMRGEAIAPFYSAQASAADDLYATVGDYARFLLEAMHHAGLSAGLAAQRDSIHATESDLAGDCDPRMVQKCPLRVGHGLGWSIWKFEDETIFVHTGSDDGEKAIAYYSVERGHGAVVLTSGGWGFLTYAEVLKHLFRDPPVIALMERAGCREASRAGINVAEAATRAGVRTTFCRSQPAPSPSTPSAP